MRFLVLEFSGGQATGFFAIPFLRNRTWTLVGFLFSAGGRLAGAPGVGLAVAEHLAAGAPDVVWGGRFLRCPRTTVSFLVGRVPLHRLQKEVGTLNPNLSTVEDLGFIASLDMFGLDKWEATPY